MKPDTKPSSDSLQNGAQVVTLDDGNQDMVVREETLFLDVNGTRLLTMRTPLGEAADKAWALGFLASEGVIQDRSEIRDLTFTPADQQTHNDGSQAADEIRVRLWRQGDIQRLGILSRTHEMRASCGLCGVQSADQLVADLPTLAENAPRITRSQIKQLVETLTSSQPLFAQSGGSHGTAIFSTEGKLLALAEDIGRHNAMDRAIGICLEQGVYLQDCVAVLSGRAGYELVIKALRVGIPILLSVGATSTLGYQLAKAAKMTLVGFIRTTEAETRMNIYVDSGRILD